MPGTLNYYLYWLRANPLVGIVAGIFWLWMLVDAIRRREWVWVLFMVIFSGFTALFYFFLVYRATASATQGFETAGGLQAEQDQGVGRPDS